MGGTVLILVISDFNVKAGSGYTSIAVGLCSYLAGLDRVVGFGYNYDRSEHNLPFSIVGTTPKEIPTQIVALLTDQHTSKDIRGVVYIGDIPVIIGLQHKISSKIPTIGIFAVEGDPLMLPWAMALGSMTHTYAISRFGADTCNEALVPTKHLPIPVAEEYVNPDAFERLRVRMQHGISRDDIVVITVADNQERKNLGVALEAFSEFAKVYPNSKYIIVTKRRQIGYNLFDLVRRYGLVSRKTVHEASAKSSVHDKVRIIESPLTNSELAQLYGASDMFLLTSKAEGLCMPIREAQAVGIPCVAPYSTAVKEQIEDGRGFPVMPHSSFVDPFGNSNRYLVSVEDTVAAMLEVMRDKENTREIVHRAKEFARGFTWEKTAQSIIENLSLQNQPPVETDS